MKRNIKLSIYGWFAAAAALLATACADELDTSFESDEYATVTFSVLPETATGLTRATADDNGQRIINISDGTSADKLIYAVYDLDDDGNPHLLPEFGNEGVGDDPNGQTVRIVEEFKQGKAREIKLSLKRNKTYKVAFWAQNSTTGAYDTKDLTRVRMWYAEYPIDNITQSATRASADEEGETPDAEDTDTPSAGDDDFQSVTPNNDELRDAFCHVETIKLQSKADLNRTIYLRRPLAQINVGTTGYDYETVVSDPAAQYAYTRVQIMTATRYLNVVTDEIETDNATDSRSALEYTYARIPAYINYTDEEFGKTPLTEADLSGKEQFLKVHLYGSTSDDGKTYNFKPYISKADAVGKSQTDLQTETFKYLSMCYILVASNKGADGKYSETSLEHLRVWIATDASGANEMQMLDLTNVPVQRNYRTNIVGEILTADIPVTVTLDPIYAGDYNGIYSDGEVADWSGPLANGVYYDAEADEILISNREGLLWFQKMVNGNLTVREFGPQKHANEQQKVKVGDPYPYYKPDGTEAKFGTGSEPDWQGIADPTVGEGNDTPENQALKARILRATHQDKNRNKYGGSTAGVWPKNNNFHFVGATLDDRATVKLMADIDLAGEEWIPIGFDAKFGETFDLLDDYLPNPNTNDKTDKSSHRGFFGVFDGNGHIVSNMETKKFSAEVHESADQTTDRGPFDNVQWFPMGFFGQIGGNAEVKNLTLRNVDILSHHCAGAIAGIAAGADKTSKTGTKINIKNCTVDGGSIINQPMHRGDVHKTDKGRSYARGCYTGGIVGMYNASGDITDCRVSSIYINGNRSVGGIVGTTLHTYEAYHDKDYNTTNSANNSDASIKPAVFNGNIIQNSVVIADRFQPFELLRHGTYEEKSDNTRVAYTFWAYGYCWGSGYGAYLSTFVGGVDSYEQDSWYFTGNSASDVRMAEFSTYFDKETQLTAARRISDISDIPLQYVPILSPWCCDEITLKASLNGRAASYKRYKTHMVYLDSEHGSLTDANNQAMVPFDLPHNLSVDWVKSSGRAGLHIEDVIFGGDKEQTLTVDEVTGTDDCALYVTSCDRKQFKGTPPTGWATNAKVELSNLLVRGNPYAYTGICLAPTTCMSEINLTNVSVYDCYYTLALDNAPNNLDSDIWPGESKPAGVALTVKTSNLRGYTAPGNDWKNVNYENVIFERGARVETETEKQENEYTLEIGTTATNGKTTLKDCTFKAPFIIKIAEGAKFDFDGCKATYGPKAVDLDVKTGCTQIVIDAQGNVTYTPDPQTTE